MSAQHTPGGWTHDRETGEHFLPVGAGKSWKVYKTAAGDYALTLHDAADGFGGDVEFFDSLPAAKAAAIAKAKGGAA